MKRLFSLVLILLTAVNLSAVTLYTPNGKSFNTYDANRKPYDYVWFETYRLENFGPGKLYPNSEVLGDFEYGLWEYNCHVFAWNNWQGAERWNGESDMWKLGKPSPYNLLWLDFPDVWYTDYDNPLGIVSYITTTNQNESSLVTYKETTGPITHSARIVGDGTRYISKWGKCPIIKHPPTEVPIYYGDLYLYYKINPAYRPVGAGDPAGRNWQTINNAFVNIPSGGLIVVLSGTQILTDNVYIPSGVTLKIKSGVIVNLASFSIINTNGILTIEPGATINGIAAYLKSGSTIRGYCGSIHTACNSAENYNTIEIQNGTYNENVTFSGKDYLTITGPGFPAYPHVNGKLSIYYSDNLDLTYSFYCNEMYLSNCQDPYIYAGIYGSGSGTGLYLYCSSYYETAPYYIWNFSIGLFNFIASGNVYANAQIFENGTAVNSFWGSVYLYGSKLCGSINYDLYATYRGYILAQNCYYDNGIPRWYGNVDIGGTYNCSYLGKVIAGNHDNNQTLLTDQNTIESDDPAIAEFREVNDLYFSLSKRVKQDIAANRIFDKAKFYNDYMNLIDNFRNYIDKYPNFPLSGTALTNIVFCFKKLQEYEVMKAFLQEIREDANFVNLRSLAKRFMIDYYRDQNDFTNALRIADEILLELKSDESATVDKPLITNTLFEKGMIYAHNLNQPAQAAEYFAIIIRDYPDDNMVDFAKHELWLLGYDIEKEMRETAVVDNLNFSINNYPNPFNPVTTINYSIPVDEKVVLKVYDILGREVAELVNEVKHAGRYSVEFNASSLSSGMYFYSITAGDYYQKKKMILMK